MRRILPILLLSILGTLRPAHGFQLNLMAGGRAEKVEGQSVEQGFAIRTRTNFYSQFPGFKAGLLVHLDFSTGNIMFPDLIAGGSFRFGNHFYLELGGGLAYSRLWGTRVALTPGLGINVAGNFHVVVPLVYKVGLAAEYMPYLGWRL